MLKSCMVLIFEHLNGKENKNTEHLLQKHSAGVYEILATFNAQENRSILLILFTQIDGIAPYDYMKDVLSREFHNASDKYNIGVGRVYPDILSLGKSYIEALKALQYHMVDNRSNIIHYDDIKVNDISETGGQIYPYDDLRKIAFHIQKGNAKEIKEMITGLINTIITGNLSSFLAKCIIFEIYNVLYKTAVKMDIDLQVIQAVNPDQYADNEPDSLEKLCKMLFKACDSLCDIINEREANENFGENSIYIQLSQYIESNYCNYEFSLKRMEQQFGLSAAYISKIFREKTGLTISEYLWDLRVKKAKNMLSGSNVPLKEIVKAIGYIDISSFNRKFKMSEGMTPGEFRRNSVKD